MLDHLDDLESDFSAIHRISDIYALDGPRFFKLAYRMSAYQGVMRMRTEEQMSREQEAPQRLQVAASRSPRGSAPTGLPAAVIAAKAPHMIERVVVS